MFPDVITSSSTIVQPFGPSFYYCDQKFAEALKDLSLQEKLHAFFLNGIEGYQKNLLMKTSHKIASLYMEIDIVSEAHGAGQIDLKEAFFEKQRLRDQIDTLHSEYLDILSTFQELRDDIPSDMEFAKEVLVEERKVLEGLEKSDPSDDITKFYFSDNKKWCAFYFNGKEITVCPTANKAQLNETILKALQHAVEYVERDHSETSQRIQALIDSHTQEMEKCKAINEKHHLVPYHEGQRARLYGMKMIEEAGYEVRKRIAEEELNEGVGIVTIAAKIGNEIRARNGVLPEHDELEFPDEDSQSLACPEFGHKEPIHVMAQPQSALNFSALKETRAAKKAPSVKFPFKAFRVLMTLIIMYVVHQMLSFK